MSRMGCEQIELRGFQSPMDRKTQSKIEQVEMRRTATQNIENKSPQIKDKRPIPFGMSRLSPVSRKSCIQTSLIYGTVCFLVRLAHEMRFGESISGAEAPSQTHDNTRAQRNEFGCSNSLVSQKV